MSSAGVVGSSRFLSSESISGFSCLQIEEAKPFVYHVKLNRTEKRNAFNRQHWE
jgi:hypothetical protein